MMRVATYSQINYNTQQNTRLSVEYAKTNQQISSGLKSETFGGIAKDTQAIQQLDSEIKRTQTYIDRITAVQGEIDVMYDVMGSMIDELDIFFNDLSAAISGGLLQPSELQNAAEAMLNSMLAGLNVNFGGRFLFGGANTGNAPVDINDPLYPTPFAALSAPNNNYYQGDNTTLSLLADDNYSIEYGIRADAPAFEQTLRALDMVINNPGDNLTQDTALDLIESATAGMINFQHEISVDAQKMESVKQAHVATKTQLENRVSDLRDVDVAEASTTLAAIETQLEASYSTTGRLLNLSILDYLR